MVPMIGRRGQPAARSERAALLRPDGLRTATGFKDPTAIINNKRNGYAGESGLFFFGDVELVDRLAGL
jgi:hypothetical protein